MTSFYCLKRTREDVVSENHHTWGHIYYGWSLCSFLEQSMNIVGEKLAMTESGKVMKLNFEGVKIDDKLKFDSYFWKYLLQCQPIKNFFDKKQILFKTFLESQFKHCPLTWMFCNRKAIVRINKLHEWTLAKWLL